MKNLKILLFGDQNKISRRLIVLIVGFSSLITLGISLAQLGIEYRDLRSAIDRQLSGVRIYVPSIANSVWDFDSKQIQRALDALVLLPHVEQARIVTSDHTEWIAGEHAGHISFLTKTYPLRHNIRGEDTEIGQLVVLSSLDAVYRQLASSALSIILSNALKTFLVVIFMMSVFRRLVTLRLENLSSKVHTMIPRLLPVRSAVETSPQPIPAGLDEIDAVDWTVDKTAEDLTLAIEALRLLNAHLEDTVKERTLELEAANKELKAFSYTLSHDLKAPLRAMSGFSMILKEDFSDKLGEKGDQHLSRIIAAAHRMDMLIDDTLGLFKVSASTFKRQAIDLSHIAQDIAGQLSGTSRDRVVKWDIQPGMNAHGDPGLIRTALENLIGNAWKYSAKQPAAQITFGTTDTAEGMTYFIKDNGAGFDMAYVDRLFTPFQRLHDEVEFAGNGVGLATVRKIIHRHGGTLWAEAAPNQGATFFFTLPD